VNIDKDNMNSKDVIVKSSDFYYETLNNPKMIKGDIFNIIYLSAKDQYWAKYAYQFAHEYCHHLIDKDFPPEHDQFGWFEETLCELASIHSLKFMADQWARGKAPYHNWINYHKALNNYADELLNRETNKYEGKLSDWISKNQYILEKDRVNRPMNLLVASKMYELFSEFPDLWNTIPTLGKVEVNSSSLMFEDYIVEWGNKIDKENKSSFNKLKSLLLN